MSEHISKDCFWYSEDIDMGAIIPFCSKKSKYMGRRDCYRCKFYISRSSVRELVNAIQSDQAKGDVKDDDQLSELRSTD